MHRPLCAVALALAFAVPAAAQDRGFVPEDYYEIVGVGDVAVSPTGAHVAFTVTTVVEDENRRHREIWLQPLDGARPAGEPFRFTSPTVEASGPRWSPDGSLLAFDSRRGDDPNSIWFLRVDGAGGEAFHIEGVDAAPVWSPDGSWIAFTRAPDSDEEAAEREGWIAPDAISNTVSAERFDGRVITSMRYKSDGTLSLRPHFSINDKRQLWVVPAEGGEPRQLTDVAFDVGGVVWSADGRRLFFTGNERQDDEHNRDLTNDIYVVAASGGAARAITANPGSEGSPAVSPDGSRLAFTSTAERGAETDVMVVDLGPDGSFRGAPRNLTPDWDLGPQGLTWSEDGDAVRFSAGVRGNRHLFSVGASGGAVRQVTTGDRQLGGISFSDAGDVLAYTATDAITPAELYIASGDGSSETRATTFNDDWLGDVTLMPAEQLTWRVADGTEIEGWVVAPVGYRPGTAYPMVLKIHGGPHGAYGNTFFPTFHALSSAGFFVLYTNPRGSSNYGHEFQYATRGQWGIVDREDYLTGVDAALERYDDIDEDRIGVSGGSYGGFMSNWLTATTDRFHASVTSRSIVNWESWWGTSDAQGLTEYEFYGPPWEQRELYRELSPISYVENVTAPTLIIHSENDYRTPIGDGEQWFMSLMKRGVPTELVRYPRSSHGLSRTGEPWLLVDRMERLRSWFVHFLGESRAVSDSDGSGSSGR
ncbi:MAG: S9 family peptidase [Gemmatimonadota bacterium]|nr:S9 family peptidase [Gemmatimonadota bacterium]